MRATIIEQSSFNLEIRRFAVFKDSNKEVQMVRIIGNLISLNQRLRSRYLHQLLHKQESGNYDNRNNVDRIPKILVQFWDDKYSIPKDVQKCLESWSILEDFGFRRVLFDEKSAEVFIRENYSSKYLRAYKKCLHPAMKADYFRLCFIYLNGGFYVDADNVYKSMNLESMFMDTKVKIQPLCYDKLTDSMVSSNEFLTLDKFTNNLVYYVNNDPLISPPKHDLINIALERATKNLLRRRVRRNKIQYITGPTNLTISLVRFTFRLKKYGLKDNFVLLEKWDDIAYADWSLAYRNDERNWRVWIGMDSGVEECS